MGLYNNIDMPEPSQFLVENLDILPCGKVLDLAMGNGRNAIFLAQHGFEVEGVDISEIEIRKVKEISSKMHLSIKAEAADLESVYQIKKSAYNVIICFNYLQRSLMGRIKEGIMDGGIIVYEAFIIDQLQYGKPHDPAHLLQHNELLRIFNDFRCLRYREGIIRGRKGLKAIASLIAQKVKQ